MTIIKKFDPVEPGKRYSKKYICVVAFCLVALMLVEIWASNNVVTYGEKFEKLSMLKKSLNMENQILENEIALKQSLSNIASKSGELGFSEPQSIQYIR
ncbi:hypothetical protein A3J19_05565 [Candidatus Daviesbacteria bacterium RIFCSPLOWO2_02_FULL_41_8]|uniref:Cell division protein FtsL n=3 Tax=Candidatus Daviesiibacteriota TaxID=1752718 RepID=A0A1F5NI74_9BACT|nr:MAG: hypothetical protein A2871_03540 [Candidatus Daviesbacteria bacterium RIFCSPHIGHO2_01_FULL_41_23]OGE32472.1 MAG: hypothetical protein A3D83_02385 [Candidatus Daviesbacteria bacterium RIFCSPHIGHO2_02_FULL_41_10]OGE61993.1 MAG: hypothetical protein A2967_03355 [Candidatus Daviesbacteria bacterium RIFCSPLOWO2_01_FULL_41_32]OGE77377.1 MAG: hypothetical protein A3J19_05565 [Candidatus Daviesbacteria bacterium RIFCSPLOWO2_02_FULL_41_8]